MTTLLAITGPQSLLNPGGESVLLQHHRPDLIVFHAYDHVTGKSSLQLSTIVWKDGWPTAALSDR